VPNAILSLLHARIVLSALSATLATFGSFSRVRKSGCYLLAHLHLPTVHLLSVARGIGVPALADLKKHQSKRIPWNRTTYACDRSSRKLAGTS